MGCDNPLTMGLAVGASVGVAVGACLQRRLHECHGGEACSALARRSVRNEIFTELAKEAGMSSDIKETIEYILQKARKLVKCERSSLFLVDKEHDDLVSLALSGQSEDTWFRVPKQKGIAGYVATNAAPLNVPDAYECPHFTSEFDQTTGFHTQSVLCLPIMSHEKMGGNGQREVIGVVQLLNKQGDTGHERFTEEDESDLREMTLLASVFLWNSSLTKFNRWAEAESSALLRTMAHLSGPPSSNTLRPASSMRPLRPSVPHIHDEVVELQKVGSGVVLSSLKPNKEEVRKLRSIFDFDVLAYHNSAAARDLLIPLSVQMWDDLGFISKFSFPAETLTNLFMALRTSYRNVPYHNFAHSFDVAHAVYGFLTKGKLSSIFTDEEVCSLRTPPQHTSHHITSHHITSHHITSHHITSHHITSHHITSHHITSQLPHFIFTTATFACARRDVSRCRPRGVEQRMEPFGNHFPQPTFRPRAAISPQEQTPVKHPSRDHVERGQQRPGDPPLQRRHPSADGPCGAGSHG